MTATDLWGQVAGRFELEARRSDYRTDPAAWVQERAREYITDDQRAICRSVVENKYTAVRSCNGVGKSHIAARIVAWWIDSHPPGEAFAVTTAPTKAQVSVVLWRYIGILHRKIHNMEGEPDLPGYITGDDVWKIAHTDSSPEEIAYGRKPADNDPGAFSGVHARYMLVVIDEACGVPKSLYQAAISLATNRNARILAIGNPDDPASYFQEVCKPGSGWNVLHIDALRSPNMTKAALKEYPQVRKLMIAAGIPPAQQEPPEAIREMLVDPGWVADRIRDYGVGTPAWSSKVRGEFPEVTIDTLISPHFVELAKAREEQPIPSMARYGVDVARYGVDKTILLLRQGAHARVIYDIPRGPVTEVAGLVQAHSAANFHASGVPTPPACVDDTGVGGGVTDILEENGYPVVPIVPGAAATQTLPNGKPRFVNRRSELLWNLREALAGKSGSGDDGWLDLDPEDHELHAQLTSIKYRYNMHGQIVVESKDEMKARGLPSPDRADALSYSLAPDPPKRQAHVENMITGDLATRSW
ncbi:MAG TPA: AAA family ATPase [Nocardioidaceae bacterium]|nr:AAA family ATPase [Nocardioidaceae bacterium]